MATDHIRYDLLVQDAFRGIFRKVLVDAAQHGLPGEHHFYITFKTGAPDVVMSDRLRAEYPEQMTIILQHQFWDLEVDEDRFAVTLSFGGQRQRIAVPFSAVESFADPAAGLELRFDETEGERLDSRDDAVDEITPVEASSDSAASDAGTGGEVLPFSRPRRR